ncbi:TetR/AcrR family transcriptional regulator [Dongia rigui]|uniref:TetR/AcrR family transcriptional regulator n=1 Tax=Dongia rigui TaxID=940149 RepID=A0ABU5E0D6_9PROT|nr:TetR/AcrR family transcriptional regulator [Dongia rigui]MDY0872645.1 TetR/AcrR family transcriptional regulator [Dongia rigui]
MKVTREKAAAHRAAIVKAAADLFRARGLGGVGVAEIMQAAGLTHGGFYGHFKSKDALAAEACTEAFTEGLQRVAADSDLANYVARYFTKAHRDRHDGGCPMVALGSEIAHQEKDVQAKFADGIAAYLAGIEDLLRRSDDGTDPVAQRAQAIATVATLVGGMILARATAETKPELSAEILETLPRVITH